MKAELKVIEQETSKAVGRGPTYHEKRIRCQQRELQKAAQLGQEAESLAAGPEVYPQSGHCPPDTKSRRGEKQLKNCITQKKPTAGGHTQS